MMNQQVSFNPPFPEGWALHGLRKDKINDNNTEKRDDIENAILKGKIEKKLTSDKRGTRYRVEGPAKDGRPIHVICRFKEDANLVIITTYALTEGS